MNSGRLHAVALHVFTLLAAVRLFTGTLGIVCGWVLGLLTGWIDACRNVADRLYPLLRSPVRW
ncbi:hypothetical protein [Thiomonas bhubaneswarensis]|uniref:hypothetical protein n=1 Tax=Thiomonas bhubaneswarensis TaxID=339866 RepID=UPI00114663F4|nr:hypothetical protein [Thiomonas bhubaneswarensis]